MTSTTALNEPTSVTRPDEVDGASPLRKSESYNPYLAARREWDERYGHLITRERNWRIMAFICALTALLAIGGMIRLSTKSRIVPFVVAMDSLGRTVAPGPAEQASPSDDRLKRATLLTWVEDLRTGTARLIRVSSR
jgi:type IV secretory pathway TrbF-like protein